MVLNLNALPANASLPLFAPQPDRPGMTLEEAGMVLTTLGAAATVFGAAWIGYEAANPPDCRPKSGSNWDFGPLFCDAFSGFRYMRPTLVVLSGATLGIAGGVLWHRGARQLARAQAQLSAGPGSISLALRW